MDAKGSFSSAELAKLLRAPVILVLDATKVTRTAAALVLGCQHLDPEVNIAGVILNQVAGRRHERVLKESIEVCCHVPVVGVLPKEKTSFFPERHLGLIPPQESENVPESVEFAASRIRDCVDLDALWQIANTAGSLGWPLPAAQAPSSRRDLGRPVVIGIIRDSAFQFYYPENLEALQEKGAVIKEISSLEPRPLPPLDALYIGGGFPETHLEVLAGNSVFRDSLKREIEAGLPVYAECGGLMFLCRGILRQQSVYPMTGVFPFEVAMEARPQGHGYTVMECVSENPYFARGTVIKGHEFHYSRVVGCDSSASFVFKLTKGHGILAGWDGMCYKNALASYSHIHAVGNEQWAEVLVRAARRYSVRGDVDPMDRQVDPESRLTEAYGYINAI